MTYIFLLFSAVCAACIASMIEGKKAGFLSLIILVSIASIGCSLLYVEKGQSTLILPSGRILHQEGFYLKSPLGYAYSYNQKTLLGGWCIAINTDELPAIYRKVGSQEQLVGLIYEAENPQERMAFFGVTAEEVRVKNCK